MVTLGSSGESCSTCPIGTFHGVILMPEPATNKLQKVVLTSDSETSV